MVKTQKPRQTKKTARPVKQAPDERPLAEKYGHLAALIAQAECFLGDGDYKEVRQCLVDCLNIIVGHRAGIFHSEPAEVAPVQRGFRPGPSED